MSIHKLHFVEIWNKLPKNLADFWLMLSLPVKGCKTYDRSLRRLNKGRSLSYVPYLLWQTFNKPHFCCCLKSIYDMQKRFFWNTCTVNDLKTLFICWDAEGKIHNRSMLSNAKEEVIKTYLDKALLLPN